MILYDISQDIFESKIYPGDPYPYLEPLQKIELADECNVSAMYFCLHTGTHADAPIHYLENEKSISELPLDIFIGKCRVIEVPNRVLVGQDIDTLLPYDCCERLLLKGNGKAWLSESASYALLEEKNLKLVGIDSISISSEKSERAAHIALLREGIPILEGLNLSKIKPGGYFLFAPPIKITGADGAPVRAVLMSPE